MNEYSTSAYNLEALVFELERLRPIVAEANALIDELAGLDPRHKIQTDSGRMVPVSYFLKRAHDALLLANDISQIEQEISRRRPGLAPG
jgi:hypothetical protein